MQRTEQQVIVAYGHKPGQVGSPVQRIGADHEACPVTRLSTLAASLAITWDLLGQIHHSGHTASWSTPTPTPKVT